jgi:hypothetical protein
MSYDRKNKRAAQAALRQQPEQHKEPVSGIGRSLMNSTEAVATTSAVGAPWGPQATTSPPASAATALPNPPLTFAQQVARAPPSRAMPPTLPPAFVPNPSGLSQTMSHAMGSSTGRSSVAAKAMLGEQNRRLSSNGLSFSPSRSSQQLPPTNSMRGFTTAELMGSSPTNGNGMAGPSSIFGTSPFGAGLFMPSSHDSNDNGFLSSPPARSAFEDMRRGYTSSQGRDDHALDDGDDDEYDEGFLPSSLSDLMTEDERRRRAIKIGGAFDPFQNSQSVPAELTLSGGRPIPPPPNAWGTMPTKVVPPSMSSSPVASRSLLSAGFHPTLSSSPSLAAPTNAFDLFSASPNTQSTLHAQILARNNAAGLYASSYDPSLHAMYHPPPNGSGSSSYSLSSDPHQSVFNPRPYFPGPGSLPSGAGVSTLHLTSAPYSGETPPHPSAFDMYGAPIPPTLILPPTTTTQQSVWNSTQSSGSWTDTASTSPSAWSGFSKPVSPNAVPRRLVGNVGVAGTSPLHHSVNRDDEIQFDMD